ncbi:Radical SAM superfamily protein [Flavobacterium columnare]|uniref:Radical SAM superfamily protein n=2 Tax=Flavobacterium TaxID=237 RepID=A0A2N9P7D1_9FLAO|nr:RiPP maturation radical SAM C-methyltransferase [Flavobacterium columnare]RVU91464.1 RiPP maturation radical SAM protein 1 [Flavobacterium columnare]SPE76239.1 Radical SAM superfamily protein [Flavobacterium columnare]
MQENIIIVIPPLTLINSPNLGVHNLQSVAKASNFKIEILYSDLIFAKKIGIEVYNYINNELMSPYEQIAERLFANKAHKNIDNNQYINSLLRLKKEKYIENENNLIWDKLFELENKIDEWVDEIIEILINKNAKIVGFSTSHQQTNACITLVNAIKKKDNTIVTLVGGSNCDGKMAKGITSLSKNIDFVFNGESEISFLDFIKQNITKENNCETIIKGQKIKKLDEIPIPNFDDYFNQLKKLNIDYEHNNIWINYETSRGCWWGVDNLCTFCGVNGSDTGYRLKSPKKIVGELMELKTKYNVNNFRMVDTLMPGSYFRNLLPMLVDIKIENIFYEMRADITYNQMKLLKNAGIKFMQIGIEAFSNNILNLINKGATYIENINVLRYARITGITIGWNLLREVPNDCINDWKQTLKIIPYLRHLDPPSGFRPVELARFSPYYETYSKYNITNLKPFDVYSEIFPSNADIDNLAWLFYGDYDCSSRSDLEIIKAIEDEVEYWNELWLNENDFPVLEIISYENEFLIIDNRKIIDTKKTHFINIEQVSVCVLGKQSIHFEKYRDWAITNKLILVVEQDYIPLCTADINIINIYLENDTIK